MGQLITVDYAARLMECSSRSVLRAARGGKLRAVEQASKRHANKTSTWLDVDSLPLAAQRAWREHFTLKLPPVQIAVMPTPAEPEPDTSISAPTSAVVSAGTSSEKLPMAQFRYAIIEPLLTGAWSRAINTTVAGIDIQSKGDFVRALAAQTWVQPDGTSTSYSESGIYLLLRRFNERGLAGLATRTRKDRDSTRLPRIVQDFVLAAYCRGGTREHADLYSLRAVMRLLDEERAKREQLYKESDPPGAHLLDYIHSRGEFSTTAPGGWAQYTADGGEPQPAEFYRLPRCSYSTVHRFIAGIPEPLKELTRRGLESYKNNCERTIVRDYASLRCMEYVVFDHRRCDLFVELKRRGKSVLVRPWETVALDMRSRCVLASVMSITPSSLTIASCIRAVIMRWGLFENAYFDNGKDFRSQYIDGDGDHQGVAWRQDWKSSEFADTRGVLAKLGVKVTHAIPYSGRSKPIEPSFRNPAVFERSLAGACGNRPHNRPEALEYLVAEFKLWLDGDATEHPFLGWDKFRGMKEWFYLEDYNRRPHTGKEMNGRAPEQVIREEYAEKGLARIVDVRALDLLMQKRKLRTVGNGGTFVAAFGGQDYVYSAPELWLRQAQQLETSYDPEDLGEMVVYEPGADFICTARCAELRRMGEQEFQQDLAEQRRLIKQTKKAQEQLHQMAVIPTVEDRMAWSRRLNPVPPLSLVGAAPTAQLDQRYEDAAAARAASATAEPAPDEPATAREEDRPALAFLEF